MTNILKKFKSTNFLFVVNTLHAFGGAERQALILAKYLKENVTHKVSFLAFQEGEDFRVLIEDAGIPIHYFPFQHHAPKYQKVLQYWRLVSFLKPLKPDVLIPYVAESNKVVAQIWKYTGARFAFWNQREEGRKLYGTRNEKRLIHSVSAVVSNSFEGRDALVRVYGLKPETITVINNGIVPYTGNIDTYNWHTHFDIDEFRPLVSMIANITKRKDHETLLKAWAIVIKVCKTKNLPLPFLVLAGRKADTYDSLRLLAFDLKLSEHIGFAGAINPVQGLISQSLFCVFSSNLEGCPNGVLECMEQGKAVVGTHISGVKQALGNTYVAQCLSEPNHPDDMAEKILKLYQQPELMSTIGAYNAARISTEFSVEQMVAQHLNLINKAKVIG